MSRCTDRPDDCDARDWLREAYMFAKNGWPLPPGWVEAVERYAQRTLDLSDYCRAPVQRVADRDPFYFPRDRCSNRPAIDGLCRLHAKTSAPTPTNARPVPEEGT